MLRPRSPTHLLTAQEVADQLSVSLRTVRRLIAQRKLAIVHIGTAVRIKPETVAAFIDEVTGGAERCQAP